MAYPRNELLDEKISYVYEQVKQGVAVRIIGLELGISPATISSRLRREGKLVKEISRPRNVWARRKGAIIRQCENGATAAQIAKTYNVSRDEIYRVLVKLDISLRRLRYKAYRKAA